MTAEHGGRTFFAGCDYVFPRETNRVMRNLIEALGGEVMEETTVPMSASRDELEDLIRGIRRARPDFVFSTLVGETGLAFLRMYHDAGLADAGPPPAAEAEIARVGPHRCAGVIASAATSWRSTGKRTRCVAALSRRHGPDRRPSMWSASAYAQARIFVLALERTETPETDRLIEAAAGLEFDAPNGPLVIDRDNNHTWLTPRIGRANSAGVFDVVWSAPEPVRPDPYLANSPVASAPASAEAS